MIRKPKRKKLLTIPKLLRKVERAVNAFVRYRDKDLGCISKGCTGQVEHAGHYFNVGVAFHSALRFDVDNIHGSCAKCNVYLSGNLIKYRQGLVDRYGEEFVKNLEEKEQRLKAYVKWDRAELEEIYSKYSKYLKKTKPSVFLANFDKEVKAIIIEKG